ncbi:MAG: PPC domain-containing protein [Planctomycetes bacterium]|nr:PPC domain-containing protein [Planctomycetota bacterium]
MMPPVSKLSRTLGLLACLLGSRVQAELPSIRFDRIQPLGVVAGQTVEVEIAGRDTEEVNALWFDHPGLKAEPTKPGKFKITANAELPEGTYEVRLIGRFGVSNPRLFAVSHELSDVLEVEPNNSVAQAQRVSLNSAIDGVSDGNGQDLYRFSARGGERIAIDCQAQKLDSALDGNLILSSAGGQILATSGDYRGRDPFIDFAVPEDGEYLVTVHDLSYRGGYPYRLLVTTRPYAENVFPRAIEQGKSAELTAIGRNFKTGQFLTATGGEPPLEIVRFPFTMPADLSTTGRFVFQEHPTVHSVLPTAATCTLDGCQVRVPVGAGALHPVALVAAPGPVTLEQEPNNEKSQPQRLQIPAMVSGRFDQPRDADWYSFEVPETGSYAFEVYSERIAGAADPYLVVIDEKDNVVVEFDDYGHRINAFDGHLRDPYGMTNLQAGKSYRVLVQDRYGRGGPRFQYVLALRRPAPDFHVAAIHSENPGPAGTNLARGGSAFLDLVIHQQDGFNGPITISAEGLPPGVHLSPTVVNNNTRGVVVLWADSDAADTQAAVRLIATGDHAGQSLRREVRGTTRVWTEPNLAASQPMRELVIGVRDTAPYSLKLVPDRLTVEAGKKAEVKIVATRHWPDFREKITVIPLGFPGNFNFGSFDIPSGQAEASLVIEVQANTRPGEYTLAALGQAQVPYHKDPKANPKPNTLVSAPSQPVTLNVTAPPK